MYSTYRCLVIFIRLLYQIIELKKQSESPEIRNFCITIALTLKITPFA